MWAAQGTCYQGPINTGLIPASVFYMSVNSLSWGMPVSCNEVPMNPEKVDHSEIKGTSELFSCPFLCPCYPEAQLSAAGHLGCLSSGSMLGSAVWAGLAAPPSSV